LTGGTTLRAASVELSNTLFRGNRAEDALNLIRCQFALREVEFHDTASDALDADFSDGTIHGGRFTSIGGDGVDVSGAKIEVDGVEFMDVNDKAISVGERSHLTARNLLIERVGTGAASKDQSELEISDSIIRDALVAGISVYTKKPEYGPASATATAVEMQNVTTPVLLQDGSRASLDGEDIDGVPLDSASLY
jgi:hypothetical protein